MYRSTVRIGVIAVLAVPATTAYGDRTDDRATIKALEARVAVMDRQLQTLRAEQGGSELAARRAEEIQGLVDDALADADTRTSLLDSGLQAGWDNGFFLADSDGMFRLEIAGQAQFRWVANLQDAAPGTDSTRSGFENRRTKLSFDGSAFEPEWKYHITGGFSSNGGGFGLQDAYLERDLGRRLSIQIGQFKSPFMREELVSSKRQLAVGRSLVSETFGQGRSQGIGLEYKADVFRFAAMLSDGFGSANGPALAEDTEFALGARAEYLISGKWKQFKDFTSWRNQDFGAMVGGALHYQKMEVGTVGGPEEEMFTWTVDASVEFGGANLFASLVGRHLEAASADQFGFVLQGGLFVHEDWEAFARYEWGEADTAGIDDLSVMTLGVNRYYHKHDLKWTIDIGFALDRVRGVFSTSGAGWRADPAGADGQIVIRSQIQLLF